MREIKFRAWDVENQEMIDADSLAFDHYEPLCDQLRDSDEMKFMQYTGLKDRNGVEIYEGDILNIYYTSSHYDEVHNHDGVYTAITGALGDVVFKFKKLLWDNYGHNQYPFNSTLSREFNSLGYRYSEQLNKNELRAADGSTYFEIIGNIHQNPELLEQNDDSKTKLDDKRRG